MWRRFGTSIPVWLFGDLSLVTYNLIWWIEFFTT